MSRASRAVSAAVVAVSLLLAAVGPAAAHEEYVVDGERDAGVGYLLDALTEPTVVGPLAAGAVVAGGAVVAYLALRPFRRDVAAFRSAMAEYRAFVPWLLRISFGIPLIGAGFGGYFVSPAVGADLRILQVGLGFLLLFGLATRLVALVTLAAYLVGLAVEPALALQLEFVGGTAAMALLGGGRPSADHVLGRMAGAPGTVYGRVDPVYDRMRAFRERVRPYEQFAPTVARVGLGATFVYLGVGQKLLRPGLALAVVENYDLTAVVPVAPELWVLGAGLTEAGLGLALVVGAFTRASAATAIATFSLTLFALPDDPVLAHVSLFGMASMLLITGAGPHSIDARLAAAAEAVRTDAPRATA